MGFATSALRLAGLKKHVAEGVKLLTVTRTGVSFLAVTGAVHPEQSRRQPAGHAATSRCRSDMTELAHTEVQPSGNTDASAPRKPFVAPSVERLGELETTTLLSGGG